MLSGGLDTMREWRMTELLRGSMKGIVLVVAQWVGCGRGGFIPSTIFFFKCLDARLGE